MSGDTWVAIDEADPDSFSGECCWVSDVGVYAGPVPIPELPDTSFVPEDANRVEYLIVPPNPDGRDDHVIGSGSPYRGTADWVKQKYFPPSTIQVFGDPSVFDSGSHLFVFWYPPTPTSTVADLPSLVTLPLDLTPYGWVTGARMGAPVPDDDPETGASGGSPAGSDVPTFTLHDTDGTLIGTLADVAAGSWQHELSAPGSLSCKVAEDDALYSSLTPKRIIKAWWRGGCRMASRIDSSAVDLAVDGRRWREFNQIPGALNMLGDGVVYPEYGKDRSSSGQRWFGYMSKALPLDSGNFTAAEGYAWSTDTSTKAGKPAGLDYPDPWWIAKNGPTFVESGGQVQIFRRTFTTSATITYQILTTADDFLTLWLDGESLFESDTQTARQWMFLQQITGTIPAGTHTLAAKVVNAHGYTDNPIAFIMTLQRLHTNGDVYLETPVVNTNAGWKVADNGPGYRRGDVFATAFDEARARGVPAFTLLSRGFTHSLSSSGVAWTDDPGEYALDAMSPVLDAVPVLTERDLDIDVEFDGLTLQAWNRKGSDLSGTVTIAAGVSAKVLHVDRVEAKFNTALIQKSDGSYVERSDATSVAALGRIETGLQLGSTSQTSTAAGVATAAFLENSDTAYTFTVAVSPLTGPQPYDDFDLGDSITLVDDEGASVKVRVLSITVQFDETLQLWVPTIEVTVDRS